MPQRPFLCFLAAMSLTLALALFVGLRVLPPAPPQTAPVGETVSSVPMAPQGRYLLRAHQGRLAVFLPGNAEPQLLFDTPLSLLPDLDQAALQAGVWAADYAELVRLIEDYIS